jgi:hypothetical protein
MPPSRDRLFNLHMASAEGFAAAQCELGKHYFLGEGVSENYSEAARLFRLAADQGDADGQCSLAGCYMQGLGVPQDDGECYRLMTLAAEQGSAPAQLMLARMDRDAGGPAAAMPREAARSLAQRAQSVDPDARSAAIGLLGDLADDRNLARTCCIGCGKTEQLQVCAKCLTAKFCSRECQQRMWPAHKPACKAWREQKAATAAEAGGASSSAQAEPGEDEEVGGEKEAADDVASLLPVKELKRRLDRLNISYAGVLERSELVALLEHAAERDGVRGAPATANGDDAIRHDGHETGRVGCVSVHTQCHSDVDRPSGIFIVRCSAPIHHDRQLMYRVHYDPTYSNGCKCSISAKDMAYWQCITQITSISYRNSDSNTRF